MGGRVFDSPEELIRFVSEPENMNSLHNIEFGEGFDLSFEIDGDTWKGEFDYRIGRFVYDLQRDLIGIFNETKKSNLSFRNKYEDLQDIVVTVRVNNGCTEIIAKLDKVLTQMIQGMTGEQITIVTISLGVLIAGGYVFKKYTDRKEKADALSANNAIALKAMELVNNNSSSFANLLAKADRNDVVRIKKGGEESAIPVPSARENLPVAEHEEPNVKSRQVWGEFSLNTLDARTYTFNLAATGIPSIRAITSFPNAEERASFSRRYADFMSESTIPRMLLLLSIVINCETNAIDGARILKVLDEIPDQVENIQDALN